MFIEEGELPLAMAAFAIKFDDILSRHRLLVGSDPFADLQIPRDAAIQRLRQVLLNLQLRLRERYALVSLREEQLAVVAAETPAAALQRRRAAAPGGRAWTIPRRRCRWPTRWATRVGPRPVATQKVREAGTLDGEAETSPRADDPGAAPAGWARGWGDAR